MKFSTLIKQLLTGACVYYAIASLLLLLINILIKGSISEVAISVLNVVLLFPFGLAMSGAQMLLKSPSLPKLAGMLLHFTITLTAFLLFLLLPANPHAKAGYYLIALLLVAILYWIGYAVVTLTKKRFQSFREE